MVQRNCLCNAICYLPCKSVSGHKFIVMDVISNVQNVSSFVTFMRRLCLCKVTLLQNNASNVSRYIMYELLVVILIEKVE